jgi:putative chitinase
VITVENLAHICKTTPTAVVSKFVSPLNSTIEEFEIVRVPEFLAQIIHESEEFNFTREIWGPTAAQKGYDTRADLGNTKPEAIAIAKSQGMPVGRYFCGVGLIQTTGYDNYLKISKHFDLPIEAVRDWMQSNEGACRSAGYFWKSHNCDSFADFEKLTRVINGGVNGLASRYAYLGRAKETV